MGVEAAARRYQLTLGLTTGLTAGADHGGLTAGADRGG